MHGKYDGAAVKQTGMLQNQYLLDTRRYSTLNASLVTQACTNTRMPLTLCPSLATLMWHDSQWLPRFASWTRTGTESGSFSCPESWISPLLDHPRSANISLFAPFVSRRSQITAFSIFFPRLVFWQFSFGPGMALTPPHANGELTRINSITPTRFSHFSWPTNKFSFSSFSASKVDKFLFHLLPSALPRSPMIILPWY